MDKRPTGWRAAFGQSSAAAGHLGKQGVGEGDLFLFFGWFRRTKVTDGKLKFCPKDLDGRHIVYAWLEVGKVVEIEKASDHRNPHSDLRFLDHHPHVRFAEHERHPNRVYLVAESGLGAGLFRSESDGLVLTRPGCKRSQWQLPKAFDSLFSDRDLSYHSREQRWKKGDDGISLTAASRGQEFVLDGSVHTAAYEYCARLIRTASRNGATCAHEF